jgi:nicotinamide mononucleotide adenylyltransferase
VRQGATLAIMIGSVMPFHATHAAIIMLLFTTNYSMVVVSKFRHASRINISQLMTINVCRVLQDLKAVNK